MSEKLKVALKWLKGLLDAESIEYQIVGGLAATIHGGDREIADIDTVSTTLMQISSLGSRISIYI